MIPLRPSMPTRPGEAAIAYASRLAAFHSPEDWTHFLADRGLNRQAISDGDPAMIEALAWHGGADSHTLAWGTIRRVGEQRFEIGKESVPREFLRRSRVLGCPSCLIDDQSGHHGRPETACYGRLTWQLAPIRTCPVHEVALIQIAEARLPSELGNFAAAIQGAFPRLSDLLANPTRRHPSSLETYVIGRLEGRPGPGWLDANSLFGAVKVCEMIGAVALHGTTPNLKALSEDNWHEAGAAGWQIASAGEGAIRRFLTALQNGCSSSAGQVGPQAVFGRLYQWLEFGDKIDEAGPFRDLVRRHVIETMPVGPGENVLGQPVTRRLVHSVHTLHQATKLHPKRLYKLLVDAGLAPACPRGATYNRLTFDAETAERLLWPVGDAVTLKGVIAYLNCPRVHAKLLEDAGFIQPRIDAEHRGRLAKHSFARADLDAFLARLLECAVPRDETDGFADIPAAAKRACCSAMEIVQLVLDRRLLRLAINPENRGYLSLLVDIDELKPLVRLAATPLGLTLREVEKRLGTSTKVIQSLIADHRDGPILKSKIVVNPINRCPQTVVFRAEVEAFEREYVNLLSLSKEQGIHFLQLRKRLDRLGVLPAFDPDLVHARFYLRRQIRLG